MLLITGTPRSGTTLLAAFCKMMGHDPGGDMKQGLHAGLEEFYARLTFERVRSAPEDCDRIVHEYSRRVFKLPHFLSRGRPEMLEFWYQRRPDLKLLILTRDPKHVATSLSKDATFGEIGTPKITALKYRHLISMFMDAVHYLNVPYQELQFPSFLKQFENVADLLTRFGGLDLKPVSEAMAEFGVTYEAGDSPQRIWEKWIDPSRVHHS